ncbi:MAG: methylmalonyl-CoA mutase, partial [bacterium]|nr:methylmalonyl-CoA mutase [bacterium]
MRDEREQIAQERAEWEQQDVAEFARRRPERRERFETFSGQELQRLYTPADASEVDYLRDLGLPGRYPFTRGPYPTMYRAQPWTMRQIAGYGTAAETNDRFRFLIAQGQTGISVDFDMPTLMGYDSDDPRSEGEVGREGVAVDTLDDLHELFRGIEIDKISVSMTINPTAWILLAMYVAMAQERGVPLVRLAGTVQNDIIKEYVAQKEWIYPPRPAMRIVRDSILYSTGHMPHYNPVNVSGYHIREAGATAVQEVAFTLAAGMAFVEEALAAGAAVDDFAPRLSFFFVSQIDFLEEVAKFRAARRIWARPMKERYGARKAESMRLRFHCQTAGASCTAREPLNNIVRTTIEALAAVLGGAQSLHTNGYDEALALPSEQAAKLALRTQQVIAH